MAAGSLPRDGEAARVITPWHLVAVLVPLAILVGTGLAGLDLGRHWDERVHFARVQRSVFAGRPLFEPYHYPGFAYLLCLSTVLPDLATGIATGDPGLQDHLTSFVRSPRFQLRARAVFLAVSSLAVIWTYLLVLLWRRSVWEALLASALLGTSWEFAYHARWVTPDAVMTQFAALTMLLLIMASLRTRQPAARLWLRLAAAAAGMGFATKYQVGILVVPVLIASFQVIPAGPRRQRLAVELIAIFGLVFVLITPEVVLEQGEFFEKLVWQHDVYAMERRDQPGSPLWGYRVAPGPVHLGKSVAYFAHTFFSHYPPIAVFLFGLAVAGAVSLVRDSRSLALLFFSFPVLYLGYMSLQRLMLVRNILAVTPFLAILAARGAAALGTLLRSIRLRVLLGLFLGALIAIDAGWLAFAAGTIRDRLSPRFIEDLSRYLAKYPQKRFLVSPMVAADLRRLGGLPPNVTTEPDGEIELVACYSKEGLTANEWLANQRNLTITWFGPWEINFNYYPSWSGDQRILLLTAARARQLGVRVPAATADPGRPRRATGREAASPASSRRAPAESDPGLPR